MTPVPFGAGLEEAREPASRRTIPFDYSFRFDLTGARGKVLNSKLVVSVEAAFTAVSIGYGVISALTPLTFGPKEDDIDDPDDRVPNRLGDVRFRDLLRALDRTLGEQQPEVLKNGFRLNPEVAQLALVDDGTARLQPGVTERLFQVLGAPAEQIQFLYALFDEGSGRAFQSDPILNIAGLGISNGDRPFYYFARPITFAPLSTIRMEITEVSEFRGELHVSLHGYKVLGGAGTPTGRVRRDRPRAGRR